MTVVTDRSLLWAKRSAVYTLSQRGMSTEGLRAKMYERAMRKYEGITPDEGHQLADFAIAFCEEHKFLNDEVFAEYRVLEGVRKGHSSRKIAMTLSDKGIGREQAQEAVSEVEDLDAALNLARKKGYGPWRRNEPDQKRVAKEASAFARNGFSSGITWKVIRMTMEEVEEREADAPMFS